MWGFNQRNSRVAIAPQFLKVFDGGYTRATAPGLLTLLVSLVASMPTKALKAEK